MRSKKTIAALFAVFMIISMFSGCSGSDEEKDGLKIITTVFPPYDFAREICGEKASVTQLLPPGTESHSYEPTSKDIVAISECDLFIYVGGVSDAWVDSILNSFDNKVNTLKMIDFVDVLDEETVEGMAAEEEEHEHEHEEGEKDEHVWTSLRNAEKICAAIEAEVSRLDPENKEIYKNNLTAYTEKLNTLDGDFTKLFSSVTDKTLVFGDRFPFRYFAEDYDIPYFAAFPGCSPNAEPSAAIIAELIKITERENTNTVFYIEFSNHLIADGIAEQTGVKTALLHSCHNVSADEKKAGSTYLSLMTQNLETLKEALK